MKNIYNISLGQLITLWIFGIAGWLWALEESSKLPWYSPSEYAGFLVWLIPFVLVFYTLGWKYERKKE